MRTYGGGRECSGPQAQDPDSLYTARTMTMLHSYESYNAQLQSLQSFSSAAPAVVINVTR